MTAVQNAIDCKGACFRKHMRDQYAALCASNPDHPRRPEWQARALFADSVTCEAFDGCTARSDSTGEVTQCN